MGTYSSPLAGARGLDGDGRPGPFLIGLADGSVASVPGPQELSAEDVLAVLVSRHAFAALIQGPVSFGLVDLAWRRYVEHFDLPPLRDVRRLFEVITDYRAQVRADLSEKFSVDLGRWWRQRRWRALLDYIDELPEASRLNEAIQNDPSVAQQIAAHREEQRLRDEEAGIEPEPWAPRVSQFDLHASQMRDLILGVWSLPGSISRILGGEAGSQPQWPLPRTEVDRAIDALHYQRAVDTLAMFGFSPSDL